MIKSIIIMRKLFYWAFAFSLCVLMGCKDDGVRMEVVRYAINEPVFMSISEFRNSVKVTDEVVPITKRGKICFSIVNIGLSDRNLFYIQTSIVNSKSCHCK